MESRSMPMHRTSTTSSSASPKDESRRPRSPCSCNKARDKSFRHHTLGTPTLSSWELLLDRRESRIEACDARIEACYAAFESVHGGSERVVLAFQAVKAFSRIPRKLR